MKLVWWITLALCGLGCMQTSAVQAGEIWPDIEIAYNDCLENGRGHVFREGFKMFGRTITDRTMRGPIVACFVADLYPGEIGALSIKTGNRPDQYRAAAVEIVEKGGAISMGDRFTNDLMLTGRRKGRMLLVPPQTKTRKFLVVMRYNGGAPTSVITCFNAVSPLAEMMKTVGRSILIGLLTGAAVDSMGFEGKAADVAQAIAQVAIGVAMNPGGPDETEETVLGALAGIAPHVSDSIFAIGGGYGLSSVMAVKTAIFYGFDRPLPGVEIY